MEGITLKNWDSADSARRLDHQGSVFVEASRSFLDSLTHIPELDKQSTLLEQLQLLDYRNIATVARVGHHQIDMCIQEQDLVEVMNQVRLILMPLYLTNQLSDS